MDITKSLEQDQYDLKNVIECLKDLIMNQHYKFKEIDDFENKVPKEYSIYDTFPIGKIYYPIREAPQGYEISLLDNMPYYKYKDNVTVFHYDLVESKTGEVISIKEVGYIENVTEISDKKDNLEVKVSIPDNGYASYGLIFDVKYVSIVSKVQVTASIKGEEFTFEYRYDIPQYVYQQVFGKVKFKYTKLVKEFNRINEEIRRDNMNEFRRIKEILKILKRYDEEEIIHFFEKVYNSECGLYEYNKEEFTIKMRKEKINIKESYTLSYEFRECLAEFGFETEITNFFILFESNGELIHIEDETSLVEASFEREIDKSLFDKEVVPLLKQIVKIEM